MVLYSVNTEGERREPSQERIEEAAAASHRLEADRRELVTLIRQLRSQAPAAIREFVEMQVAACEAHRAASAWRGEPRLENRVIDEAIQEWKEVLEGTRDEVALNEYVFGDSWSISKAR
jgi:hypothetical protein